MNYYHSYESQLPELTLPQNELATLVKTLLAQKSGSFDFRGFVNELGSYFARIKTGFPVASNTDYKGVLNECDVTRVREIIWDLIIDRTLTPGGYIEDRWPLLTISERGATYLKKYRP